MIDDEIEKRLRDLENHILTRLKQALNHMVILRQHFDLLSMKHEAVRARVEALEEEIDNLKDQTGSL